MKAFVVYVYANADLFCLNLNHLEQFKWHLNQETTTFMKKNWLFLLTCNKFVLDSNNLRNDAVG